MEEVDEGPSQNSSTYGYYEDETIVGVEDYEDALPVLELDDDNVEGSLGLVEGVGDGVEQGGSAQAKVEKPKNKGPEDADFDAPAWGPKYPGMCPSASSEAGCQQLSEHKPCDYAKHPEGVVDSSKEVYICNLPKTMTEQDVRELCSRFGQLESVSLMTKRYQPDAFTGACCIKYTDTLSARKAIYGIPLEDFPSHEAAVECRYRVNTITASPMTINTTQKSDKQRNQKSGNWVCRVPSCANVNYPHRSVCNRCKAPKPHDYQHDQNNMDSAETTFPTNVYVGHLPDNTTDASLREMFESFGEIEKCSLFLDKGVHLRPVPTSIGA